MNVLIVTNMYPVPNIPYYGIFVKEQFESLKKNFPNDSYEIIFINTLQSKMEYIYGITLLRNRLKKNNIDLIHAHYGYTGFICSMVNKDIPLVTTFHGSDINNRFQRIFSTMCEYRNKHSIIVAEEMYAKKKWRREISVIPCGVNTEVFYPLEKEKARSTLGIDQNEIIIVFPANPKNKNKNYPLFQSAVAKLHNAVKKNIKVRVFDGLTREEINLWNNAADLMLLTSLKEGSPTVIKEAMACNLPVISVDVGDIRTTLKDVTPSIITNYDSNNIANAIIEIIALNNRSNGREILFRLGLDNNTIAMKIHEIYERILNTPNI